MKPVESNDIAVKESKKKIKSNPERDKKEEKNKEIRKKMKIVLEKKK